MSAEYGAEFVADLAKTYSQELRCHAEQTAGENCSALHPSADSARWCLPQSQI
jgi:hypothetical protein